MNETEKDAIRIQKKRDVARTSLHEFRKWHNVDNRLEENALLLFGLLRDIRRESEEEVDRIISELEDRNNQMLLKKLGSGL